MRLVAIQQRTALPSGDRASANAQMPLLAPMVLVTAFTVGLDGLISTTATPPYWVSGAYKRPLGLITVVGHGIPTGSLSVMVATMAAVVE